MLNITRLHSLYGRSPALHGIDLQVPAGQITAVLGRNGMGKTTLLRAIMGLTVRSTGSILLDGQAIDGLDTHQRARRGIAYVPQGRDIIPDFSVAENILMGGFANRRGVRALPALLPELFPYLAQHLQRPGGVLSGGQQQQLAIARAMAAEPSVMLLDEPNEGIQPSIVEEIEATILRLNRELGMTLVLVEQNIAFVRRAASRFVMLEKGQVACAGPIDQLSDDLVHRYMGV